MKARYRVANVYGVDNQTEEAVVGGRRSSGRCVAGSAGLEVSEFALLTDQSLLTPLGFVRRRGAVRASRITAAV